MFRLVHHHGGSFGPQNSTVAFILVSRSSILSDIGTFTNNGYRSDVIDVVAIFVTLPNFLDPKRTP